MPDDQLSASLAEMRSRHYKISLITGEPICQSDRHAWPCHAHRALAAVEAVLALHSCVPWYAAAEGCAHPEPQDEDSEEHDDWYDDHPMGSTGIQICKLEQVASYCPECTRLEYDTTEPEDDGGFTEAPCLTRSAILAGLNGEEADGASRG